MKCIISKYTNIIIYKYTVIILSQYAKHASQIHICDHRERTARTFLYDKNTSCNTSQHTTPFCPASYFDILGVLNEDSLKGMMSIISLKRSAILSP